MRRPVALLLGAATLVAATLALTPDPARAATHTYRAQISGDQEVPAVASGVTGTVSVTVDDAAGTVCAYLDLDGLDLADITGMHVHTGVAGANGGIAVNFTPGATACTPSVDAELIDDIVADPAGFYFNAHTAEFTGGAARGQLALVAPSPTPTRLTAELSGAAEVPANASPTTGAVAVTVDPATGLVCVTLELQNQTVDGITAMHIHEGEAGANGPVVIGFPPGATACAVGPDATVTALAAEPEGFYFNVHTAAFPDGEARGQLEMLSIATPSVPGPAPTTTTTTTPGATVPVPVVATPRYTG